MKNRISINRSVSFDPVLFQQMEDRRAKLMMMTRSEYIVRCILKDVTAGGEMKVTEVPATFRSEEPRRIRRRR